MPKHARTAPFEHQRPTHYHTTHVPGGMPEALILPRNRTLGGVLIEVGEATYGMQYNHEHGGVSVYGLATDGLRGVLHGRHRGDPERYDTAVLDADPIRKNLFSGHTDVIGPQILDPRIENPVSMTTTTEEGDITFGHMKVILQEDSVGLYSPTDEPITVYTPVVTMQRTDEI